MRDACTFDDSCASDGRGAVHRTGLRRDNPAGHRYIPAPVRRSGLAARPWGLYSQGVCMRYCALAVLAALTGLGGPGLGAQARGAWAGAGAAGDAGGTPVINPAALTLTPDFTSSIGNAAAVRPRHLAMLADEPESIYPTPNVERPREEEGFNAGGVNFHLT